MQPLTLSSANAVVKLFPAIGGAIARFRHAGFDVLRPTSDDAIASANVRGFAAYPLVPYSNRIANARLLAPTGDYVLDRNFGESPHPIHGIGWQRGWTLLDADTDRAMIALDHVPDGDASRAWPFAFRATQAIALTEHASSAMLSLTMTIENRDTRPSPFGLGWHPFFHCDATTELGFSARGIWRTDDTRLPTRHDDVDGAACFDPPRAIGSTTLDNVFTGWSGHAELRWPAAGRGARIEADRSLAFLVVFIPDDRGYLAVEPVTHMTDGFNRAARGDAGTGTMLLEPGEARSCTMRIVAQTHPA